jgi:hypothetical protein
MSGRKIVAAQANIDRPNEIIVMLDNGVKIDLSLKSKLDDPKFAEICELSLPKTDGERLYWLNGASLTVDEIMEMLRA